MTKSFRLWPPVHAFWFGLRHVGVRDRLRCPDCRAVGTWKPHGGPSAMETRKARRWLCKWCGYYQGPEGVLRCWPDPDLGVWRLPEDGVDPAPTPAELVKPAKLWPWVG